MKRINEEQRFKPTLDKPMSNQSKSFDKNFKKTMTKVAPDIKLNEVDGLLTEVEQSLKKKIFSLAKMEALVFSDPKLSTVYEQMAKNGEENYGYHYNETIQNMIFNDYVLNSPKYLQKYKMAIPKEKKRRDKSGINQLKKAGEDKMTQSGLPKKPKPEVTEGNEPLTKVMFLVNETDPQNSDLFAYFPEETFDNQGNKAGYSHVGQHGGVDPRYAEESRPATPEEYQDLKAELESIGYNLDVVNSQNESTGAASAGAFAPALGYKKVEETTTSASSGAYVGPAAWSAKGDLMGSKGKPIRKPLWPGGKIIQETQYLTDPSGFEKYVQKLNEQIDIENPSVAQKPNTSPYTNKAVNDKIIDKTSAFTSNAVKNWNKPDTELELNTLNSKKFDEPNLKEDLNNFYQNLDPKQAVQKASTDYTFAMKSGNQGQAQKIAGNLKTHLDANRYNWKQDPYAMEILGDFIQEELSPENEKITTVDQLKQMKVNGQKITKEIIPNMAGQALYTIAVQMANRLLPIHWNDLPDTNSMWDYINENGGMTFEELQEAVKEAANDRLSEEGMSLGDLGMDEVAKSKAQQRLFGMAHAVQKGELPASKVGGAVKKIANDVSQKDVEDFASTKHDNLPEKLDENLDAKYTADDVYKYVVKSRYIIGFQGREDILFFKNEVDALNYVNDKPKTREYLGINNNLPEKLNELSLHDTVKYISDRQGEKPFELGGIRWQFVNARYPDGKIDIGVYRYGHDLVYDYSKWKEDMNINEETSQSIVAKPSVGSMANYAAPAGDQGGNVPMGTQQTAGLQESVDMKLLEELNNELNAFSIHHQKLVKMNEDRKISAEVNRERVIAQNPTNFKKDLQDSGTKEVIDVEKELQWKDQQTDVNDPQKLGQDIEKTEIKTTDAKGDEALKNVGDSTNDKGDEIPKRNLTSKEQEEVNMYRLGQHSLVYDNEPSKKFEDRMKADMGDDIYKMRQKQMEFRSKAPMYNKDTQPTETGIDKVQFNKEKSGWNEREGLKESMITGRYLDAFGKRRLIDFKMGEVKLCENAENFFELDFTGLGNTYNSKTIDNKVVVNEGVVNVISTHKFYTDGKNIVAVKNPVQTLTEGVKKEKPVVNEQFDKMKHLLGYKPDDFVNTKNVKKNRGF